SADLPAHVRRRLGAGHDIDDDDLVVADLGKGLVRVGRGGDRVADARQRGRDRLTEDGIGVDEKDGAGGHGCLRGGMVRWSRRATDPETGGREDTTGGPQPAVGRPTATGSRRGDARSNAGPPEARQWSSCYTPHPPFGSA